MKILATLALSAALTAASPLPFRNVQEIISRGGAIFISYRCPNGETGITVVTNDFAVLLMEKRAIIIDQKEGDDTPVWFVRVDGEKNFILEFTMTYKEAKDKYPRPCDYLTGDVLITQ